jgi:hypothetical protein
VRRHQDEEKSYTPVQFNDRVHVREHCLTLGYSLLVSIGKLDKRPIDNESNAAFADVRDRLSDLCKHIEGLAK